MRAEQNSTKGILLMIASAAVFSAQDGISRHLGESVNVYMVVMIRFWVFALFVLLSSSRARGGLRAVIRSKRPVIQFLRGALLITEICLMVVAYVNLGLIETHAIFACYPLLVAALSGPILGEKVGWRRWAAIAVGFVGVIIILNPGGGIVSPYSLVAFCGALTFAIYGLLTRYVAADDSAETSFFWIGIIGAVLITPLGLLHWQSMSLGDWGLTGILCLTAILGHGLLIKAYDVAEASVIQPFAFFQLPMISVIGLLIFSEVLRLNVVIGALIVVSAGLFTLWRQHMQEKRKRALS